MSKPLYALLALAAAGMISSMSAAEADAAKGVKITETDNKLRVEVNGALFTEYCFRGAPHVYFYPIIGPGGIPMTRNYPMVADSEGEEHDHPHHRSLWYSHGAVNGVDFWAETPKAGKIVHDKFLEIRSGAEAGVIKSVNKWIAPDGSVPCTSEQTVTIFASPQNERMLDYEVTLKAGDKDVVLGDTKEGTMGVRVAESMRLTHGKGKPGKGHIVQSTGVRDGQTWGKKAEWCDYYGPVQDKTVGIAIMDHPKNPRFPTWWHVRDYGLFAANPFGVHDFEKKPAGAGDLKIPAGQSVTFRYRFLFHEGDEKQGHVAERYQEFTK